jgi:hypothetical protein
MPEKPDGASFLKNRPNVKGDNNLIFPVNKYLILGPIKIHI